MKAKSNDHFDGEWFKTGDISLLDDAGHLHIVGRVNEMHRTGGENVYPAEVEAALQGIPGVDEFAVVGVPDEKWGVTVLGLPMTLLATDLP